MPKQQLQQIKIFKVSDYLTTELLEQAVNEYVVERYNKEGNYAHIVTNSKFISVLGVCLVETKR